MSRISLSDIITSNRNLSIFEPRLFRTRKDRWTYNQAEFVPIKRKHSFITNADKDPFHTNNIEEYDGSEEGLFKNGDLLLSFRSINLVVVVRPENKKVVWFVYGLTSRQHDPDFLGPNKVMIYDNNFHNEFSRIVEVEAFGSSDKNHSFGARITKEYKKIGADSFQQLTGGSQFLTPKDNILIFPANYYVAGIERETEKALFAIRSKVNSEEDRFMQIGMLRELSSNEIDEIMNAKCE